MGPFRAPLTLEIYAGIPWKAPLTLFARPLPTYIFGPAEVQGVGIPLEIYGVTLHILRTPGQALNGTRPHIYQEVVCHLGLFLTELPIFESCSN